MYVLSSQSYRSPSEAAHTLTASTASISLRVSGLLVSFISGMILSGGVFFEHIQRSSSFSSQLLPSFVIKTGSYKIKGALNA